MKFSRFIRRSNGHKMSALAIIVITLCGATNPSTAQSPGQATLVSTTSKSESTKLIESANQLIRRETFAMNIFGKKRGWLVSETWIGEYQDSPACYMQEHLYLTTFNDEIFEYWERQVFSLQGDGPLLLAEEINDENGETRHYLAHRVNESTMRVDLCFSDQQLSREIDASQICLKSEIDYENWLRGDRNEGDSFRRPVLDLNDEIMATTENWRFTGWATDDSRRTFVLESEMPITYLLDEDANTHRIKMEAIEFLPESGSDLDSIDQSGMGLWQIPIEKSIENQTSLEKMVIEIRGLDSDQVEWFTASPRQTRVDSEGSVCLEVCRDEVGMRSAADLSEARRIELTASDELLQSDHPSIDELAQSIAGGETGDLDKVLRLNTWVFENIDYKSNSDEPGAVWIAKHRIGDCSEYARLFVAMTRALGLPSEQVYGLAYSVTGDQPALVGHAWARVAVDGQWITVDPCWNQVYVDATHIEVDDFVNALLYLYDGISIEVVDLQYSKIVAEKTANVEKLDSAMYATSYFASVFQRTSMRLADVYYQQVKREHLAAEDIEEDVNTILSMNKLGYEAMQKLGNHSEPDEKRVLDGLSTIMELQNQKLEALMQFARNPDRETDALYLKADTQLQESVEKFIASLR